MILKNNSISFLLLLVLFVMGTACHDLLDEPAENRVFTGETDYTKSDNMILPLIGVYGEFYDRGWENFPLISVRGDDVNAGGLGDQQDYAETDKYNYNKDFWMYNALWEGLYKDIYAAYSAIEEINLYKENGADPALADQYIAEISVMQSFLLFQVARVWGNIFIPESTDPSDLLVTELASKDDVMKFISDKMEMAIPNLPAIRPNERKDVKGGVTRYTALAMKALADLEQNEYQKVADATNEIIKSEKFKLENDYYNLFKIPGKLNDENLLELQFSDFGQGTGDAKTHLFAFYGPTSWNPKVPNAGAGWGFYEPSLKWIKFMLDRGERKRLETSVLFTNRGINTLKATYPSMKPLPEWISNITPSGDTINDYQRALFASGKHYLPSEQLTPGRTDYGTNKNFICIRYAEVLLMHAEALTNGATGTAKTADQAVNEVRQRAGLSPLTGVSNKQVMDEKFAELAMEWGIRYYDMVRTKNYDELSYEGRKFSEDKVYLPYPQNQVDNLPNLKK